MKFRYQKIPFHGYDSQKPLVARPFLPVYLHKKQESTRSPYYALLDSGADNVLFPSDLAVAVGESDFTKGRIEQVIGVAGQKADVYFYDSLELQVLGDSRKLPTPIGFSDKIFIPILGRSFFRHFKTVIFNEEKEEIELKF